MCFSKKILYMHTQKKGKQVAFVEFYHDNLLQTLKIEGNHFQV